MSTPHRAYIPRSVLRLASHPGGPWCGEDVAGAFMLVDIAGFTPMAEAWGKRGRRGTEELTGLLNAVLGAVITRIEGSGGEIWKFAGDAVLAAWTGPDAVGRAASTAWDLHRVAAAVAGERDVTLHLTAAVAAGTVRLWLLRGSDARWEHVPLGPPLEQLARALHAARPSETVLASEAAAALSGRVEVVVGGDGRQILRGSVLGVGPAPAVDEAPDGEEVAPLLHPAVRGRWTGDGAWLDELRQVSVVFVRLVVPGDADGAALHGCVATVCAVAEAAGGVVDKVTSDDKGLLAICAWGLPPRSHADDPLLAVRAALRLRDELLALGMLGGIGVASGTVFCGVVGSAARREYTVIGDTVNVAARLMQQADRGVLVDEATARAARGMMAFSPAMTLHLKGKSLEVRAFVPTPGQAPVALADSVRDPELRVFRAALDRLRDGRGGVVVLTGEQGQGKTSLLRQVASEARSRGVLVVEGAGDLLERDAAYLAWRSILAGLLHLDLSARPEERARRLEARLARDPVARDEVPLLAEILAVPVADGEHTRGLTGEVRAFRTQDLVVHLLRGVTTGAGARELVIIVDDAHVVDSASFALLRQVIRGVEGVLVVVAGRPFVADGAASEVLAHPDAVRVELAPLDVTGISALVERLLGAPPDPDLAARVHARTEGNAFFAAEVVRALADAGALEVSPQRARLRAEADVDAALPTTVQAAVVARIDRLDAVAQLVAKVASVIGRAFSLDLLRAIHPVPAQQPMLGGAAHELVEADLTEVMDAGGDGAWRYRHELIREVAYETLLYAQRRRLHEAVAEALASRTTGALPHARLAVHWESAERLDRAFPALEAAGDQALREGAYEEALRALDRAEALAGRLGDVTADRSARLALQRGEALLGLGRLAESKASLEDAVRRFGFPVRTSTLGMVAELVVYGGVQVARRVFGLRPRALAPGRREVHLQAARGSLRVIETCFFLAGPVETLVAALRALRIAEAAGPSPELARAYALFGWILSMIPWFRAADHYLALANDLASRPEGEAARQPVRFFTGFTRTATGRWEEAREALREAIELARVAGDKRRWIEAVCGICSPMHYVGEFEARVGLGREVLYTSARRQGDLQAEAWGILDQIESLLPLGDDARLAPLLDDLVPYLGRDIGRSEVVWAQGLLAHGRLLQGREDDALRAATAAVEAARRMDPVAVYVFEGYAGAAEVLLELATRGRSDVAAPLREALRQLRRYARVFPYARARSLSADGRFQALRGARGAQATLRAAVSAAEAVRMPLEEGIARWALSALTADAGERARAHALFERFGAHAWLRRMATTGRG